MAKGSLPATPRRPIQRRKPQAKIQRSWRSKCLWGILLSAVASLALLALRPRMLSPPNSVAGSPFRHPQRASMLLSAASLPIGSRELAYTDIDHDNLVVATRFLPTSLENATSANPKPTIPDSARYAPALDSHDDDDDDDDIDDGGMLVNRNAADVPNTFIAAFGGASNISILEQACSLDLGCLRCTKSRWSAHERSHITSSGYRRRVNFDLLDVRCFYDGDIAASVGIKLTNTLLTDRELHPPQNDDSFKLTYLRNAPVYGHDCFVYKVVRNGVDRIIYFYRVDKVVVSIEGESHRPHEMVANLALEAENLTEDQLESVVGSLVAFAYDSSMALGRLAVRASHSVIDSLYAVMDAVAAVTVDSVNGASVVGAVVDDLTALVRNSRVTRARSLLRNTERLAVWIRRLVDARDEGDALLPSEHVDRAAALLPTIESYGRFLRHPHSRITPGQAERLNGLLVPLMAFQASIRSSIAADVFLSPRFIVCLALTIATLAGALLYRRSLLEPSTSLSSFPLPNEAGMDDVTEDFDESNATEKISDDAASSDTVSSSTTPNVFSSNPVTVTATTTTTSAATAAQANTSANNSGAGGDESEDADDESLSVGGAAPLAVLPGSRRLSKRPYRYRISGSGAGRLSGSSFPAVADDLGDARTPIDDTVFVVANHIASRAPADRDSDEELYTRRWNQRRGSFPLVSTSSTGAANQSSAATTSTTASTTPAATATTTITTTSTAIPSTAATAASAAPATASTTTLTPASTGVNATSPGSTNLSHSTPPAAVSAPESDANTGEASASGSRTSAPESVSILSSGTAESGAGGGKKRSKKKKKNKHAAASGMDTAEAVLSPPDAARLPQSATTTTATSTLQNDKSTTESPNVSASTSQGVTVETLSSGAPPSSSTDADATPASPLTSAEGSSALATSTPTGDDKICTRVGQMDTSSTSTLQPQQQKTRMSATVTPTSTPLSQQEQPSNGSATRPARSTLALLPNDSSSSVFSPIAFANDDEVAYGRFDLPPPSPGCYSDASSASSLSNRSVSSRRRERRKRAAEKAKDNHSSTKQLPDSSVADHAVPAMGRSSLGTERLTRTGSSSSQTDSIAGSRVAPAQSFDGSTEDDDDNSSVKSIDLSIVDDVEWQPFCCNCGMGGHLFDKCTEPTLQQSLDSQRESALSMAASMMKAQGVKPHLALADGTQVYAIPVAVAVAPTTSRPASAASASDPDAFESVRKQQQQQQQQEQQQQDEPVATDALSEGGLDHPTNLIRSRSRRALSASSTFDTTPPPSSSKFGKASRGTKTSRASATRAGYDSDGSASQPHLHQSAQQQRYEVEDDEVRPLGSMMSSLPPLTKSSSWADLVLNEDDSLPNESEYDAFNDGYASAGGYESSPAIASGLSASHYGTSSVTQTPGRYRPLRISSASESDDGLSTGAFRGSRNNSPGQGGSPGAPSSKLTPRGNSGSRRRFSFTGPHHRISAPLAFDTIDSAPRRRQSNSFSVEHII